MAIYQRGKNWYVDFHFHGQRIREMIGPSRKGADKVIANRKAEIAENKFLDVRKDSDPIKFHQFAKRFLEWTKVNHKPSSRAMELSNMRTLERGFQNKNIHEITSWEIEKWKQRRKGEIKPASVNRELGTLKSMLSKAVEWECLKESPARKVKSLKGVTKRLRYLMPDELQRLISNCSDHLRPIVIVLAHTGMRKGEALTLTWGRVDFEKEIITLTDTKNNECRHVPMDETGKATLRNIVRTSDYLFPGLKPGKPLVWVELSFHNALKESGIEDFKLHHLRQTFASNLVMAGVDLMTVKELLGHKTIGMTLRYAHLAPERKMKAVNILDSVMSLNPPLEKEQERKVLEFKR